MAMHGHWALNRQMPSAPATHLNAFRKLHCRQHHGLSAHTKSHWRLDCNWSQKSLIHLPSLNNSSSSGSSSSSSSNNACRPFPRQSHSRSARTNGNSSAAGAHRSSQALATAASGSGTDAAGKPQLHAPVVIIGGGPAGLCSALMLARRGYTNIKVYESLPEPPAPDDLKVWGNFEQASERLYMIGLNGRGQSVLRDLQVMDRIDQASSLVHGRLDWQPGTPTDSPKLTRYTTRTYITRCIQRDRLASCLLQELRAKHGLTVSVEFGVRCTGVDWYKAGPAGQEVCRLTLQRQHVRGSSSAGSSTGSSIGISGSAAAVPAEGSEWMEESSFVIGADGAASSLRNAMELSSSSSSSSSSSDGSFKVRRFEDKNKIVYRTIPLFWPKEMADTRPGDLNYSVRTKSGLNMDCLPTKEGPFIAVMLYKPGDPRITALKTADDVRKLFQEHFPAFLPAIRAIDLQRFAQKQDSNLPTFSFAGPVLHHGSTVCLLGDAIHTVKPYFGQGVNSAFEDVKVLQQALQETDDDAAAAVQRYSQLRSEDAEALVKLSRSLDGGFFTFVGPLILDSLLHKLLPALFSPNIIASLQNEKWRFSQIRFRKRVDRAMQVGLVVGLVLLLSRVVVGLLGFMSRLSGGMM